MKKIYILIFALVAGSCAFAQTIVNPGMETWRSSTAGGISGGPVDTIYAPTSWYGFDSIIIDDGETYGHLIGAGNDWNAQVFEESTIVHSGSHSAKLITVTQDILGNIPSILSNSAIAFNVSTYQATGSVTQALTFTGGTPITQRIATVSAWVRYIAGHDTSGVTGPDTASMTITVYGKVPAGTTFVDSAVGKATLQILPNTTWTQVTAQVAYTDSVDGADTLRILFASSGNAGMDSSTLYVDDVSAVYAPATAVKNVTAQNDVKVYPNPTSGMLHIEGAGNAGGNFQLYAVNGQLMANKTLTGKDAIDVSSLSDGLYFYTISDASGSVIQRGKVSVLR